MAIKIGCEYGSARPSRQSPTHIMHIVNAFQYISAAKVEAEMYVRIETMAVTELICYDANVCIDIDLNEFFAIYFSSPALLSETAKNFNNP